MRKSHKITSIMLILMLIGVFLCQNLAYGLRPPMAMSKTGEEIGAVLQDLIDLQVGLIKVERFIEDVDANEMHMKDNMLLRDAILAVSDLKDILERIMDSRGGEIVGPSWNASWHLTSRLISILKDDQDIVTSDEWVWTKEYFTTFKSGILKWLEVQDRESPGLPDNIEKQKEIKKYGYFCAMCMDENIYYETKHFKVRAEDYPLALGHLLIVPKAHNIFNMAMLNEAQSEELEKLILFMRKSLSERHGSDVVFFEHGSASDDEEKARQSKSIVHAHMGVLPVPEGFNMLLGLMDKPYIAIRQVDFFKDMSQRIKTGRPYFFYEHTDGSRYIFEIHDSHALPSQFLRQLIAKGLKNPYWNWKEKLPGADYAHNSLFKLTKDLLSIKSLQIRKNI